MLWSVFFEYLDEILAEIRQCNLWFNIDDKNIYNIVLDDGHEITHVTGDGITRYKGVMTVNTRDKNIQIPINKIKYIYRVKEKGVHLN